MWRLSSIEKSIESFGIVWEITLIYAIQYDSFLRILDTKVSNYIQLHSVDKVYFKALMDLKISTFLSNNNRS